MSRRSWCPECKEEVETPEKSILRACGMRDEQIGATKFYRGRGCESCKDRGYRGRRAIYEVMVMNNRLRDLAFNSAPTDEVRKQAILDGMHTLMMDGVRKLVEGITTPDEILAVAKNVD